MFTINSRQVRSLVILVTCFVGLAAAAFLSRALISARQKQQAFQQTPQLPSIFFRDGFDFDKLRSEDNQWKGPPFGEKLDLTQLRGRDNASPPRPGTTQLLMVVAVNPACGMCRVAADEMRDVRDMVVPMGVPYYVVSLVPLGNSQGFFQYSDSLDLGVPAFFWASKEQPLASLSTMVVPSHLLLDKNGVIIRTWPGSNDDKIFRIRMTNQIVGDTHVICDSLAALTQGAAGKLFTTKDNKLSHLTIVQ